jgi:hypothetical protein
MPERGLAISNPFPHHVPVPTRARAAPIVNRTARLKTVDQANRFVSASENTYGTSGTAPAITNAMKVARHCLIGNASCSGSCCASRTRSSERMRSSRNAGDDCKRRDHAVIRPVNEIANVVSYCS